MSLGKLTTAATLCLLTAAIVVTQAAAGGPPQPGLDRAELRKELRAAITAQERVTDQLVDLVRVVGTGVGLDANGEPVVNVLATTKNVANVPKRIDGVRTEVVVTGPFSAQQFNCPSGTQGFCDRPVPGGVSTGHPDITAGTLGARVVDAGGNVYALSNNHVYANENLATIGDTVLQPGTFDGGSLQNPDRALGVLHDFVSIDFCPIFIIFPMCDGIDNRVDAAIALVNADHVLTETFCGWTPSATTVPMSALVPNVTQVKKCGRTTGLTTGVVTAVNVQVDVGYATGVARFEGQIMFSDISDGGDSGSLVVDLNNQPLGLLFAGSDTNTIASPIDDVLSALGVPIDDGGTGGTPGDTTPPAAPTSLTATDGQFQVQLDWDDNTEPDLDTYTLHRATSQGSPYTPIANSLTTSDHVDTTAQNGTTYYYVVTARDESGGVGVDPVVLTP